MLKLLERMAVETVVPNGFDVTWIRVDLLHIRDDLIAGGVRVGAGVGVRVEWSDGEQGGVG